LIEGTRLGEEPVVPSGMWAVHFQVGQVEAGSFPREEADVDEGSGHG
jgi:hypothetical protein